jgi:hypothetical protein
VDRSLLDFGLRWFAALKAFDPESVELPDPHPNAALVPPDPPRNIRCRKPIGRKQHDPGSKVVVSRWGILDPLL